MYIRYCRVHFSESRLRWLWDKKLFKELLSYAGWNLFGGVSNVLYTHGLNLLLNIFFGPAVNAARGVAVQVQHVVVHFSHNFQMALNPQITKLYAANEMASMHKLVYRSSKFTFMLLFVLSLPLCYETPFILSTWLSEVPEWSVTFVRIMLCTVIVDAMANPFMTAVAATGKVKIYQMTIGGMMILIVPISYLFLRHGFPPYIVFFVHLMMCVVAFVARLFFVKNMLQMKIGRFVGEVLLRCAAVMVVSFGVIFVMELLLIKETSFLSIARIVLSGGVAVVASYLCGLTANEKKAVNKKIVNVFKRMRTQ